MSMVSSRNFTADIAEFEDEPIGPTSHGDVEDSEVKADIVHRE